MDMAVKQAAINGFGFFLFLSFSFFIFKYIFAAVAVVVVVLLLMSSIVASSIQSWTKVLTVRGSLKIITDVNYGLSLYLS